jgi:hypothetical protein
MSGEDNLKALKVNLQFFNDGSVAFFRAEMTLPLRLSDFSSTKEYVPRPALATSLTRYLLQPEPTPKE